MSDEQMSDRTPTDPAPANQDTADDVTVAASGAEPRDDAAGVATVVVSAASNVPKMVIRRSGDPLPEDAPSAEAANSPAPAGADTAIVETAVSLTRPGGDDTASPDAKRDSAAATAKIREARGSNAPTSRIREETVDLTAARAEARDAADQAAERAAKQPPTRDNEKSVSLAVTFWLVAAVIGAIAAVLAFHPGSPPVNSNKAFVDNGETSELMSQAAKRACAPFTYQWDKYDDSLKNARAALTGTALKNLNDYAATSRKLVTQGKAGMDCHADTLGVENLSGDKATVLIGFIMSSTSDGTPTGSDTPRMRMNFVKHGDQWLISEYDTV